MRRREFITLLGGAAAVWPLAASAQQRAKLPTIGFWAEHAFGQQRMGQRFCAALRDLGWIENSTITIDYRWGKDSASAPPRSRPNSSGSRSMSLSRQELRKPSRQSRRPVIPIVFATAGDPVGNDLVASLARPGGNVTGLATMLADLAGKRLELLRQVVPGLNRVAIMANVGNPFSVLELREVQAAAGTLGLEVDTLEIRQAQDIAPAFEALKGRAGALYVNNSNPPRRKRGRPCEIHLPGLALRHLCKCNASAFTVC